MPEDEIGIKISIKDAVKAVGEIKAVERAIGGIRKAVNLSSKDLAAHSATGLSTFASLTGAIRSTTSTLAQYSATAGAVGLAAGTAVVGVGVKTAAGLEQTNVALKQLMGSQAKATEFTNQIQDFAERTPFQFTDTVRNAQQMIAKGFAPGETLDALEAIGNAASGLNAGQEGVDGISRALGQMRMKANLSAEEMNGQLAEWGINGWKYLAEASGRSIGQVQKDAEKGLIGGAAASNVILKGLQAEYKGMMDAQSRTLGGRWSTLIDKTKRSLYRVDSDGKEGGIMAPLLVTLRDDILPAAFRLTDRWVPKLERGMGRIVGQVRYLARGYQLGGSNQLVESFGNLIGVGDRLVPIWKRIKEDGSNMAAVWQNSLWPAIKNVSSILGPLVGGALTGLERVLEWMADHPTAASRIFTALGVALSVWAIEATLLKVAGAIRAVTLGFGAAQLAALKFTGVLPALAAATGIGSPPMITNASKTTSNPTTVTRDPVTGKFSGPGITNGALETAEKSTGRWAGVKNFLKGVGSDVGGAKGNGVGFAWEASQKNGSAQDIVNKLNSQPVTKHAGGGTKSVTGVALVGEQGPERVRLPGGSQITNNQALMKEMAGAGGSSAPVLNFHEGAFQGFDFSQTKRITDAIIAELGNKVARK